jgi:anti-sigma-K factor RskA
MSADALDPGGDVDLLAAEYVLRLLDAEERMEAQRRLGSDPAFAQSVADWEERFAPLLSAIAPEQPPEHVWTALEARITTGGGEGGNNIVALRRRLKVWRGYSLATTAVAASLALVLAYQTSRPPAVAPAPPRAEAATFVASLASDDNPARLVVSWEASTQSLVVAPAVLDPAAGHDHQLWLIADGGTPQSLGLVNARQPQRLVIPLKLLRELGENASVALSVEPTGGSPTGLPTGPVIAAGQLHKI